MSNKRPPERKQCQNIYTQVGGRRRESGGHGAPWSNVGRAAFLKLALGIIESKEWREVTRSYAALEVQACHGWRSTMSKKKVCGTRAGVHWRWSNTWPGRWQLHHAARQIRRGQP